VDRVAVALAVLARVVRRQPSTRMIVTGALRWGAGKAAAAAETRRMVRDLGLENRVELTGPYTQDEAPSLYTRADLLLHCKYNDPSPGVIVEALACGLPVVYSATGGVPELVGDAGIGVPSELSWDRNLRPDVDTMAEAVIEAAAHRKTLSDLARRRAVERFDLQPWLDRHAAIFAEVAKGPRPGV
jgi:glycosyltransferase involved in cell wall biosynthesis